MNEVIADYLTVTVPSGSIPPHSLADYFVGIASHTIREEGAKTLYFTSDGGALIHTAAKGFDRIAASGRILHHFRALGIFRDYLSLIADHPHNVTRLDLARDVPVNPADVLPVLILGGPVLTRNDCQLRKRSRLSIHARTSLRSPGTRRKLVRRVFPGFSS